VPNGRSPQVLHNFSDVVVATLAGHAHLDGYFQDEAGIHHRCMHVLAAQMKSRTLSRSPWLGCCI
jgi:hypothetical protein